MKNASDGGPAVAGVTSQRPSARTAAYRRASGSASAGRAAQHPGRPSAAMRSEMKVLVVTAVAPFGIGREIGSEKNATPLRQDEGGQPRGTTMT